MWNAVGVDAVARCLARRPASAPVFAYRFEWGAAGSDGESVLPGRWGRRLGAFHCLDTPFFFGTDTFRGMLGWLLFNRQNEPGREALSSLMMRYVARFIRTGDPNCESLPRWDPWCCAPGGPKALIFDAGPAELRVSMSCRDSTAADAALALRRSFPVTIAEEVLANESRLPPSDFEE